MIIVMNLQKDGINMKKNEFKYMLNIIQQKLGGIDPTKVFVEFTWWAGKYKPLIAFDCDMETNTNILVFGNEECGKNTKSYPYPTYSYGIPKYAITLDKVIKMVEIAQFDEINFLLMSDDVPVNCFVDINPFKTKLFIKPIPKYDKHVLAFFASDGGSESKKSIYKLTTNSIEIVKD